MAIKYSIAEKMDEKSTAEKIAEDVGEISPPLVVFFASSNYNIEEIGKQVRDKMNTKVIGCTTSGELASGHMLKESVVAMGLGNETLTNFSINTIDTNAISVSNIVDKVKTDMGVEPQQLDQNKHVGMILIDGLSGKEETVMDAIGPQLLVPVVGGSAGDDLKFNETYVFDNEGAKKGAAVLVILELENGFDIVKTQSFSETGKKLIPTNVDEANRKVIEFNHEPALEAYAKAIGKTKEEAAELFMTHPLGLMIDGEPFVRSPQRAEGDTIYFYCQIKEGMELSILQSEDIVGSTKEVLDNLGEDKRGIINFHCILRTLELEKRGQTQDYADLFSNIPTIGFSTYGEEYIGHINQTSTMIVFK